MHYRHAMRVTAWMTLGLILALPAQADEKDAEAVLSEAWHLLEVDRKPEQALERYETLRGSSNPASVRARALLGMARANRLLGRAEAAERCVDEAFRLSPELAAVREAMRRDGPDAKRSRYMGGTVRLAEAQGLDLDGGGVFPGRATPAGGRVEIFNGPEGAQRPPGAKVDAAFSRRVSYPGPRAWLRVVTDEERVAWFQVLVPGRQPVIRFVTRITGANGILPEVRNTFCLGGGDGGGIALHFDPMLEFTSYRIEMRRDASASFEPLAKVAKPPFLHTDAEPGVRYTYRLTGLDKDGNAGIPTTLLGTTKSHGLFSGTLDMRRGESFDLLTGVKVSEGGDLKLVNTYGGSSAARFIDAHGQAVRAIAPTAIPPRTLWDGQSAEHANYVEDGLQFMVQLRGGGIARCRLQMRDGRRGGPEATVHYDVQPDGMAFPEAPTLTVERDSQGVRVRVHGLEPGMQVTEVTVRDLLQDTPPRVLTRAEGAASFLDTLVDPDGEPLLRYEATPVDKHGRRGATARGEFDGSNPGVRTGTFRMHYKQGYSFRRQAVVPVEEADVVFSGCAGGISSIELTAPGGIVGMERSLRPPLLRNRRAGDPALLAEAVLGVDPEKLRMRGRADGDDRRPAADVFVVKMRDGSWARLAIVQRDERAKGGWEKKKATFKFAWNPKEPWFGSEPQSATAIVRPDGYIVQSVESVLEARRKKLLGDRSSKPVTGECEFHYKQGYSFERGAIVDKETDADVWFDNSAGGTASVTLTSAGGIVNLSDLFRRDVRGDRAALLDAIVAIEDDKFLSRSQSATGDSRTPADDVFLLRTRNGGYVKLAIVSRSEGGSWTKRPIYVRYVFNPGAAAFTEATTDAVSRHPLLIRTAAAGSFPDVPRPRLEPAGPPRAAVRKPTYVPPPAAAYIKPTPAKPPVAWLAPYRTERATAEAYDRLRVDLLRNPDDALVVAGLVFLAGAHDPHYRRLAARSLPGAYVLGAQGGPGAAHALRGLAKDPDAWTRHAALGIGRMFDSPLARELLLTHLASDPQQPEGKVWARVWPMIEDYVKSYADRFDLRALLEGDEKARSDWIAAAPMRPATADKGRFTIVELEDGKRYRWQVTPSDAAMGREGRGHDMVASGFRVLRTEGSPVSGDASTLSEYFDGGGMISGGGATLYALSRGGSGGALSETVTRVIGEGRLRVWRRAYGK